MLTQLEEKELQVLEDLQRDYTRPMLQEEWDRLNALRKKRYNHLKKQKPEFMTRIKIPVALLEFDEGGNTVWVHNDQGATVFRIAVMGDIETYESKDHVLTYGEAMANEITFNLVDGSYLRDMMAKPIEEDLTQKEIGLLKLVAHTFASALKNLDLGISRVEDLRGIFGGGKRD